MRIFIVGYMGSGKSTLGPRLANALDVEFIDLDQLFEITYKISIYDFFHKYGENQFRSIEHKLLCDVVSKESFVLSTGGGTPCFHDNMAFMNHHGITVFLNPPFPVLLKRIKNSPKKRPVLKEFEGSDYENYALMHYRQREPFYNMANIIVTDSVINADKIADLVKTKNLLINGG